MTRLSTACSTLFEKIKTLTAKLRTYKEENEALRNENQTLRDELTEQKVGEQRRQQHPAAVGRESCAPMAPGECGSAGFCFTGGLLSFAPLASLIRHLCVDTNCLHCIRLQLARRGLSCFEFLWEANSPPLCRHGRPWQFPKAQSLGGRSVLKDLLTL